MFEKTMQTCIDGACIHFATMNHHNAPNFILNNWLYDIWGYEQMPNGKPKRHLDNGVFLDWATSNTTVKNNYVYNSAAAPIRATECQSDNSSAAWLAFIRVAASSHITNHKPSRACLSPPTAAP